MSLPATAQDLCEWTGGSLVRGQHEATFSGTVIDSRAVEDQNLFVAIVGPNHNAHRFLGDVLAGDSAGALIQSDHSIETLPTGSGFVVSVTDTTQALADLARGHRRSFTGPLIGITGSNGKTTTKELCADILNVAGPTLATLGNLNNNFGVPLTLLRRDASDIFSVVEMGMNHRGEIAGLAEIADPNIGILTNVGTAHIEFLGDRETIAEEKGDLLAALPESGTAVVGRDDPLAFAQAQRSMARVLSFGRDTKADLRASAIRFVGDGTFVFKLETPFGRGEIRVAGLAETIVENSLAAAGGALAADVSFETVAEGLANHRGVPGRMQPRPLSNDVLVIDDTYNANPQSMQNALETLARLQSSGRRFAVLGQMGELGNAANEAHRALGRLAASLKLDGLFLLAPSSALIAEGAEAEGFDRERIKTSTDHQALAQALGSELSKGDVVLVKGSRAAGMERVIQLLEEAGH
jgi:UDP-N-acetylmuramoyl-tripeptide--D-alanyl-D-alanine ligase